MKKEVSRVDLTDLRAEMICLAAAQDGLPSQVQGTAEAVDAQPKRNEETRKIVKKNQKRALQAKERVQAEMARIKATPARMVSHYLYIDKSGPVSKVRRALVDVKLIQVSQV